MSDTGALDETRRKQNLASDPGHSAWVSANAGSGKTHVLTQRVIRLMLDGARPSAILCLTYTKAAASEMSIRVFERLSHWTALNDTELANEIESMEGQRPDAFKLAEARRLFARALETPGGLKIQTIHAFCEALLHQFPLEANVAGHFSVLDDKAAASLLSEARRGLLTATQAERDSALAAAFHDVLTVADEFGLDKLLQEIVSSRGALHRFFEASRSEGPKVALRNALGIGLDVTAADIAARAWPLPGLSEGRVQDYIALANGTGGSKAQERAFALGQARSAEDPLERLELLRSVFFKKSDELPYAPTGFYTTAMRKVDPATCDAMVAAADYVVTLWQELKIFRMFEATRSALVLAERLISGYEGLKKERGFLDFEDFITRTEALLKKRDIGPWVHYKLDQGIDHLLLDEAQDTSPSQWEIIMSLTDEFFSGDSARMVNRTIFTVGDEKQSIYSFQGARPERFAIERRRAMDRADSGAKRFEPLQLQVSFRSTQDVLSAVDQVFSIEDNARGLSADKTAVIHESSRINHAGAVDIWDIIAEEGSYDEDEDWLAPFDRPAEKSSIVQLAQRMAAVIKGMVGREVLDTRHGPRHVAAGDILVLVRKRDAFAGALARELKKADSNVGVAGTDRLVLSSHIAIQDLMALAKFSLLHEDDLSLAALIKSPLIDMGEDDLDLLCGRRGSDQTVWARLKELSASDPRWLSVHDKLLRWVRMACSMRVHDFYACLLGREGGRKLFLSRFGHEVSDVLDEFLNFALAHEETGIPGLTSFVTTVEQDSPEIKREQDKGRDEVRIMTVHASKGLEAPVVFLVDGGSKAFDKTMLPKLRLIPRGEGQAELPLWIPSKEYQNRLSVDDDMRLGALAEEEYRRLLYVGMTRASDRLVLCGYRKKRPVTGTWAELATLAISLREDKCVPATFRAGPYEWAGYKWRHHAEKDHQPAQTIAPEVGEESGLPDSLFEPIALAPSLPRPLAPSGVHAVIDNEDGDRIVPSALFTGTASGTGAQVKGKIVHRLLQALPDFEPAERHAAAQRYLARAMPQWSEAVRDALTDDVLVIIDDPRFASLFGPGSRSEVSVMGTIRIKGRDYAISGRIDRMGEADGRVFILDYKTNRVPPARREDIPFAHIAQLALYREVLSPLFAGKAVECLLIYTEGPHLYTLEPGELEKALLAISSQ